MCREALCFGADESSLQTQVALLFSAHMNVLIVGADPTPALEYTGANFLLIDDGPLIDALILPPRRKVVHFDVGKHHLNPLQRMDYLKAREFISILDAVFPEGTNTLTKKNSNFVLLEALLNNPRHLDRLIYPDKDPARQDAYQKIQTLLFSPVLKEVFSKARDFSMAGVVLARLDRAVLGDFDAFVLGNVLISQFHGQVIAPGFYLRDHHTALIRQNRLVACLTTLSDVSDTLLANLLTIPEKIASQANADDAEVLARYEGMVPRTMGHEDYMKEAIGFA